MDKEPTHNHGGSDTDGGVNGANPGATPTHQQRSERRFNSVAEILASRPERTPDEAERLRNLIVQWRQAAKHNSLEGLKIEDLVEEGRR